MLLFSHSIIFAIMGKIKLFNDPIYGLIDLRYDILYDIINEPYFQRLRRIKQMGMSDMVYPGATHTRFQHAIGATYLLHQAFDTLERKNIDITLEEKTATSIAILCHDIGHGPFSHALEKIIVPFSHEEITSVYLSYMKAKYGNIIQLAINIFENKYHKQFLHQLISSQLDVDRLDYLSRDSFYSGVAEGIIGYDRIIKMMNVVNNNIVIDEKGLYSIEKYLTARYIMYMQVYLHKTSIVAEKMLSAFVSRLKNNDPEISNNNLDERISYLFALRNFDIDIEQFIHNFSFLDDTDIWHLIKQSANSEDKIVKFLSKSLLERKLFKVHLRSDEILNKQGNEFTSKTLLNISEEDKKYLFYSGELIIEKYSQKLQEILIFTKENQVFEYSSFMKSEKENYQNEVKKFRYFIYPKD